MALLTGRSTFSRLKVVGQSPKTFNEEHVTRLAEKSAGTSRMASADGVDVGWITGQHCLDTNFTLEKNIVNDALSFALRVDCDRIPGDKLKAYTAIELAALSKDNPSGIPSAKQKREAKEIARERIEEEAKDGRYRKSTVIPVLWDAKSGEVWYGATSFTHLTRFTSLFKQTFGATLEVVTAGYLAYSLMAKADVTSRQVDDATPTKFTDKSQADIAWIADESSRDFLGNEFLLWLWYFLDQVTDSVTIDGNGGEEVEVTMMLARNLIVDCPNGDGRDTFKTDGPTRLPEARRAIANGKLPRRVGMTAVRYNQQYEFALNAESFAIGAAKMPPVAEDITDPRARLEERVTQLRDLVETIDAVYASFLAARLDKSWNEAKLVENWLANK